MCCGCGRDQSKPESPRKRPRILTGSAAVTARMLWPAQASAACVHVTRRPSGLCDAAARGSGIASPKEMLHRRHHGRGFSRRADGSRQSRRRERTLVLRQTFSSLLQTQHQGPDSHRPDDTHASTRDRHTHTLPRSHSPTLTLSHHITASSIGGTPSPPSPPPIGGGAATAGGGGSAGGGGGTPREARKSWAGWRGGGGGGGTTAG
jgi:hypothetical protein